MSGKDCVFCRVIRGEIPSTKLAETAKAIVIRDINPQAPTHLLVIPKVHVESITHLEDTTLVAEMFDLIKKVTQDIGLDKTGFRTSINTGKGGGQTVFHLHAHVLAGRAMSEKMG